VNRQSVISANKYVGAIKPPEFIGEVMDGVKQRYMLDIHNVSEVNEPEIRLDLIEGPAHSEDFEIADEKRQEKENK
jgi:NADH-quinone oxidoreductase subunit G